MNKSIQNLTRANNSSFRRIVVLFVVSILLAGTSIAQGDLLLFPKRIIFEGGKKSHVLNVANTGKDSVRYRISVVQVKMKDDGSFETITSPEAGQQFADKHFRFFPRSVMLGPNEAQTVKIQLINTDGLSSGEYRSHLYFRAEADKRPLGEEDTRKDSSAISVRLVAVFGISIPVIIRTGEFDAQVSIDDAVFKMNDTIPSLHIQFKREGLHSVYGDINVHYVPPAGKTILVGQARGMAIYTPNRLRHFNLLLESGNGIDYKNGKLKITYSKPAESRSTVMAEKEIILN